jgi:hypothetical protein
MSTMLVCDFCLDGEYAVLNRGRATGEPTPATCDFCGADGQCLPLPCDGAPAETQAILDNFLLLMRSRMARHEIAHPPFGHGAPMSLCAGFSSPLPPGTRAIKIQHALKIAPPQRRAGCACDPWPPRSEEAVCNACVERYVAGMKAAARRIAEAAARAREAAASPTFTCDKCHGTFPKGWTEEEARAEAKANFGAAANGPCGVLCDDCHREFMAWEGAPS